MAGGQGRRVLVVEDEALIALELDGVLRRAGYEVVGPVPRADEADRLAATAALDVAVLDIELAGAPVYPTADTLARRGVPFVFFTGYEPASLPGRFRGRPVVPKPCSLERLPAVLARAAREQRVRDRAHALWEREGRPAGAEARHWAQAEAELRAEEG